MKKSSKKSATLQEIKATAIAVSLIFVFGFILTAFNYSAKSSSFSLTGNVVSNGNSADGQIKVLSSEKFYDESNYLIVTGLVENTVGKTLSYAEVKIKFYNLNGELIQTTSESINAFASGEKWRFETIYPDFDSSSVDSYEIVVGEVW